MFFGDKLARIKRKGQMMSNKDWKLLVAAVSFSFILGFVCGATVKVIYTNLSKEPGEEKEVVTNLAPQERQEQELVQKEEWIELEDQ